MSQHRRSTSQCSRHELTQNRILPYQIVLLRNVSLVSMTMFPSRSRYTPPTALLNLNPSRYMLLIPLLLPRNCHSYAVSHRNLSDILWDPSAAEGVTWPLNKILQVATTLLPRYAFLPRSRRSLPLWSCASRHLCNAPTPCRPQSLLHN
jgi:hypothetical protein